MSRQVFVSPERMVVQKLEKYPAALQDSHFDHSRFQEIEAEFKALDIDQSGWLSLQEIESHLKRKGCDQMLIQEIFNDLNTNQDTKISKDEFTHGYLTKEQNIKNKIKQLELEIKELRINSQEIVQQTNDTNIQQLIIKLLSGCLSQHYKQQDDIIKASKQIEIHFECNEATDGHERISKPSLNCEFPVWGETFNYSLNQVQKINLKLKLYELYKLEKEPLGMNILQLPLEIDFEKQEKIIIDDVGDILLQIQYVSDWNLYLQTQLQVNQNQINELLELVKQQKTKLYYMKQLYVMDSQMSNKKQKDQIHLSNLALAKQENQYVQSMIHSDNKAQQYETQPVINNQQQNIDDQIPIQQINKQEIRQATSIYKNYLPQMEIQDAFNLFKHSISEPEEMIVNLDSINNQEKFKLLCILASIITINIAFGHCDFIGLIIILLSLPYQNKKWNDQQVKFFTIGIGFSLILDIYWIIKYTNCFSNLDQCNNEFGFASIIYFLCILTILGKIFLIYKIRSYQ